MRPIASILLALLLLLGPLPAPVGGPQTATAGTLKVGLVRSTLTQSWVDSHGRGYGVLTKQDAVRNYLAGKGYDVTVLSDADLDDLDKLRQYDVVVLMWVFAMKANAAQNLVTYVGEGNGLVTLYASPRVNPDVAGETNAHWLKILNSNSWEWGPLSEVNQTTFVDDFGAIEFRADPVAHPIVDGAKSILAGRGLSAADMRLYRQPGHWVELVSMFPANENTSLFLNMTPLSVATGSKHYPGAHPGAVAAEYLKGRYAYFYFSPVDFLPNFNQDNTANRVLSSGVKQGEVAAAYVESAIAWAADTAGTYGPIIRDGRTYALVNASSGGIYASQYVHNPGNVAVTGTLHFRVYDPKGKLVKDSKRHKIGVHPGLLYRYSESYIAPLSSSGSYRVEIEFNTSYPSYGRRHVETLHVRRGQGSGLRTAYDEARSSGSYVEDPRIVRVAGSDRYSTALRIADEAGGYPRPGGYVVFASGAGGPDALCASSLAAAYDAPLLLTKRDALPEQVRAWITNPAKGVDKAIIVGGESAIGASVEIELRELLGESDVSRIGGPSRFETAARIAAHVEERLGAAQDGGVIVCNGNALADAAGASALAAGRRWPLLFVKKSEVPTPTQAALSQMTSGAPSPGVWIAGGEGVVSAEVEAGLAGYAPTWRASGASRYDTAARLAQRAVDTGASWENVGLASGQVFVDALALGPLLGRLNAPLLLTPKAALDAYPAQKLAANGAALRKINVGGGTKAVSDNALVGVIGALP